MNIKVKKLHPDAVLPARSLSNDAGFDLVAINDGQIVLADNGTKLFIEYKTGLSIEPPPGYHTEILARSSISKTNLILSNGVGLIDESYRGEILLRFKMTEPNSIIYKKGDRIGQLIVRKTEELQFEWAEELSETSRGSGGFGSTGN